MKFKRGLYGGPKVKLVDEAYKLGFDAVFTSPSREVALRAKSLGLFYAPLIWIPKTNNISLGVVNAWGQVKLFAFNNSGCILNPALMEDALSRIERIVDETDANTIILDALRFPSPHDIDFFFSCFCRYCRDFMKLIGVDSEKLAENIRRAAKQLHLHPHLNPDAFHALNTLFYVRQKIVEHVLTEIADLAEKLGVRLWGAFFPPSLAWTVGQNYSILRKFMDQVQVMLYHSGGGAACLNHELTSLAKLISKFSSLDLEDALKASSYLTGIEVNLPFDILESGLPLNIIYSEFLRARRIIDNVIPIFWFDEYLNPILREMEGLLDVIAIFKPGGL